MPNRRSFLKKSLLAGTSVLMPGAVQSISQSSFSKGESYKPLILSTWQHGMPANEKAWEVPEELSPKAAEAYEEWKEESEYKPMINIENL